MIALPSDGLLFLWIWKEKEKEKEKDDCSAIGRVISLGLMFQSIAENPRNSLDMCWKKNKNISSCKITT